MNIAHRLAAEALVDAALCIRFQGGHGSAAISGKLRAQLVETVLRDPSFTEVLFSDEFLSTDSLGFESQAGKLMPFNSVELH